MDDEINECYSATLRLNILWKRSDNKRDVFVNLRFQALLLLLGKRASLEDAHYH